MYLIDHVFWTSEGMMTTKSKAEPFGKPGKLFNEFGCHIPVCVSSHASIDHAMADPTAPAWRNVHDYSKNIVKGQVQSAAWEMARKRRENYMKRDIDSGLQLRFEATARMPSILQQDNGNMSPGSQQSNKRFKSKRKWKWKWSCHHNQWVCGCVSRRRRLPESPKAPTG